MNESVAAGIAHQPDPLSPMRSEPFTSQGGPPQVEGRGSRLAPLGREALPLTPGAPLGAEPFKSSGAWGAGGGAGSGLEGSGKLEGAEGTARAKGGGARISADEKVSAGTAPIVCGGTGGMSSGRAPRLESREAEALRDGRRQPWCQGASLAGASRRQV